jgi:hypothetical protein
LDLLSVICFFIPVFSGYSTESTIKAIKLELSSRYFRFEMYQNLAYIDDSAPYFKKLGFSPNRSDQLKPDLITHTIRFLFLAVDYLSTASQNY